MDTKKRLEGLPRSYDNFVKHVCSQIRKHPEFEEKINKFLDDNPEAKPDDVLEYLIYDLLKKQY